MGYEPTFTITPVLLGKVEEIAALRQRIQDASVQLDWIPALQKDARMRNTHASTAIEGNPLTLAEVRAIADGTPAPAATRRTSREILNYLAGLRFIDEHAGAQTLSHEHVLALHRILATGVMDQGEPGRYRDQRVFVGSYRPPEPEDVPALMTNLLDWWNGPSAVLTPTITSAIVHYRFETIHPFADGNGRTGRALALWELYRRGFDTHHIFSVDEYYWEDRLGYYDALARVRNEGEDLTSWLEYSAGGLKQTLEAVWKRILLATPLGREPLVLRPKQERLLQLLSVQGGMAPAEIRETLGVSKQGAMDTINPLIEAGLIEKVGSHKSGRYRLKSL